ncbi:MAG: hypothetical protein RLZZ200_1558 [Pseudomonadota bacterium]
MTWRCVQDVLPSFPPESLADLYDSAPVGYLTVLEDGRIVRANGTLGQMVGQPVAALIGKNWMEHLLSQAGRLMFETHVRPLLTLSGKAREISVSFQRADHQRVPVLLYFESRDDDGFVPRHLRISVLENAGRRKVERDLIEARRAAEENGQSLLEMTEDLEKRIVERTQDLRFMVDQLDLFSAAVSHDLRAPVRAIMRFAELLGEEFGEQLGEEGRQYLAKLDRSAHSMSDLITGLLSLAKGARGEIFIESISVTDMARDIAEQLSGEASGRDLQWEIEPDLRVKADRRLFESVMRNLLDNARKYSAATGKVRVRVHGEQVGTHRYICVTDNGIGFTEREATNLFKPFTRLPGAKAFAGTGIGLATAQRIIQRHRGLIEAIGQPGQGATFRFWIPD